MLDDSPLGHPVGDYCSPVQHSFSDTSLRERIELLVAQEVRLRRDDRIVDTEASLARVDIDSLVLTNNDGRVAQRFHNVFPNLRVTANDGSNTQTRTYGGGAYCGQGGLEVLDRFGFGTAAERVADQAPRVGPHRPSAPWPACRASHRSRRTRPGSAEVRGSGVAPTA